MKIAADQILPLQIKAAEKCDFVNIQVFADGKAQAFAKKRFYIYKK